MAVITLNDLVYSTPIRNWDLNDGFGGSLLVGSSSNTEQLPQIDFGDVLEIEFPEIDYSQYTSQDYLIDLWEFGNGVQIKLAMRFYPIGAGTSYAYTAYLQGWYNNSNIGLFNTGALAPTGDQAQVSNIAMCHPSNTGGSGFNYDVTTTVARGHYIKAFVATEYHGNSVAGVTHPTRCSFNVLFPFQYVDGTLPNVDLMLQTYENVVSGMSCTRREWAYKTSRFGNSYSLICAIGQSVQWLDVLNTKLNQANPYPSGKDPWDDEMSPDDDPSKPGGGDGQYVQESDPIDYPILPTGGPITSGMIKAFLMDAVTIEQFQDKLWNMSIFDITTQFQKLLNEPLNCVISLHCLPFVPTTGTSQHIKLGSFDTEVSAARITANYMEIDCGTLNIKKMWGSALDYGPYTKDIEIYLPFIGFRNIQIEDAQGSTLECKYYVDVLTGSCVAFIKCGPSVLYSFTGNCLSHIPVSGSSSDLLKTIIGTGSSMAIGLVAGNPASAAAGAIAGAVNTATAKNHVTRTGELAGAAGILGEFKPYVILHRPKQSLAKNYNKFKGYPSNITSKLSALRGYTEVEHIHLTNIEGATDAELQQIESLLKNGVII